MCDIPAVQPAIRYNLQFSRSQNFRDAEPPRTSEMANRRDAEASKLAVSLMEEYAVGITNLVIAIWRPLLFPVLNRLPNSLGNQASQFHIFHSHDNFKSSRLDWSRSYCGRLQWPCNFLGPVAQRLLVREPHKKTSQRGLTQMEERLKLLHLPHLALQENELQKCSKPLCEKNF